MQMNGNPQKFVWKVGYMCFTFDISSSWLAKCARQWTQEYVRFDGGKYAWNVFTILELFRCSPAASELQYLSVDYCDTCVINTGPMRRPNGMETEYKKKKKNTKNREHLLF